MYFRKYFNVFFILAVCLSIALSGCGSSSSGGSSEKNDAANIVFDPNGGKFWDGSVEAKTSDSFAAGQRIAWPQKEGYVVSGWNTESDGTGTSYTLNTLPDENITLYAQWEADNKNRLAYYITSNYVWSNIGIIKGDSDVNNISIEVKSIPIPVYQDDPVGDVKIHAISTDPTSNSAVMVLERYALEKRSVFTAFNSNGQANAVTIAENETVWGDSESNPDDSVINARSVIRVGDYIYAISYDKAKISKINAITNELVSSLKLEDIEGEMPYGEDIIFYKGRIFALFTARNTSFEYKNSVVYEINHTNDNNAPTFGTFAVVGKNASKLVTSGDYIYVPATGGGLNPTCNDAETKIDRITIKTDGIEVDSEPVFYGTASGYNITDMAVGETETLIFHSLYNKNSQIDWKLSKIQTAELHTSTNRPLTELTDHLEQGIASNQYFWKISYDPVYKHFWFFQGSPLKIYSEDFNQFKEFSMSDLDAQGMSTASFKLITQNITQ